MTTEIQATASLELFLEESNLIVRKQADLSSFTFFHVVDGVVLPCFAKIWEENDFFTFYIVLLDQTPSSLRTFVAEYITRANYGLLAGNFEMDYEDGEVRFKSSVAYRGENLTPGMIRNAVHLAIKSAEFYRSGLLRVCQENKSALEALAELEETGAHL